MQLLRGDLPRGALRTDAPPDVVQRCACREQADPGCHIYTEAWPASLAWLDGAPLVSAELAPCPAAPHFRMQFFHTYHNWTHEASTRDTMALVRARLLHEGGGVVRCLARMPAKPQALQRVPLPASACWQVKRKWCAYQRALSQPLGVSGTFRAPTIQRNGVPWRCARCVMGALRAQVRGAVCQRPGSLVYVAGAPTHEQHEREGHPWARMDARFSVRHLIAPMRNLAQQSAVPPENLVRLPDTPTPSLIVTLAALPDARGARQCPNAKRPTTGNAY